MDVWDDRSRCREESKVGASSHTPYVVIYGVKYTRKYGKVKKNFAVGAVGCLGSATNCATVSRKPRLGDASVLGNGGINLVGPGEDAALPVEDFAETRLAQE